MKSQRLEEGNIPQTALLHEQKTDPDGGKASEDKRRPLPALTGVRIFAAYYVVTLHTGAGYARRHHAPPILLHFLDNGYMAVSLFFVLSGFILAYTYSSQVADGSIKRRFWEARVARIYPVYLLSLLVMVPFSMATTVWQRAGVLTMVQTWIPGPWQPDLGSAWNFPAWSLSVEAFFYLLFPFLLPHLHRMKTSVLRGLGIALMVLIAAGNLARPIEQWAQSPDAWLRMMPMPFFRLPEFILGAAAGILFLRTGRLPRSGLTASVAAATSIALLCIVSGRWASLAVVPFAVMIAGLAGQSGLLARLLSNRLLVLLGGASYSVYLLQLPVRSYTRLLAAKVLWMPRGLDQFLSPILLLLVSLLVFLYWEEPARRALRSFFHLRPRWKWPYIPAPKA